MKRGNKIWMKRLGKLALLMIIYWVLLRSGLNPFWSILVILYWKAILKLSLFLGGLAYVLTLMMY